MGSVLIRAKGAAIFRAAFPEGWTKFARAVASRDPKRYLGQRRPWPSATLGSPRRSMALPSPPLCLVVLHRRSLSCLLLPLAPMGVVKRIVGISCNPQAVQEHRELPRYCHRRPLLGVL